MARFFKHRGAPTLERPSAPDTRTPDDFAARFPMNFEREFAELPPTIEVGDPRLDDLVLKLHRAAINPVDTPIPLANLPPRSADQQRIRVVIPSDIREGASPLEYAIPVPVDAFVAAPEIEDWRQGRRDLKNGRASSSVIAEYAGKSARTAAPVSDVRVYIRPDGAIYAALSGDGAHRLCAAKWRGDSDILCRNVTIIKT